MKPKSKKDQYIVKCKSKKETNQVLRFIYESFGLDFNYSFEKWKYVKNDRPDRELIIFSNIHEEDQNLNILSFKGRQELPDDVLKEKESEFNSTPIFEGHIERFEKPILEDTFSTRKVESKKFHLHSHKTKQIIGYKLVKEEYKEAINLICGNNIKSNFLLENTFQDKSSYFEHFSKAGVMHWFNPVYKSETITLKSGVELSESDIDEVRGMLIDRYAKL